uniref:Sulfotransferase n=1 Tax=Manihot esculenta TaxID=3983 RepID=A0A2C9V6J9_MANES
MSDVSVTGNKISPINHARYKEIISTLPQKNSWRRSQQLHKYQGFWCFPTILEGIMAAQEQFIAHPTDIIACSHPKSGTTWLKALCFAILTRAQFNNSSTNPLLTESPHDIVPWIEFLAFTGKNRDPELPLLATHIPYNFLPKSIGEANCKIVYIWYWKASLDFSERILFIKYEDLKNDTFSYVKRVAEFMGYPFSAEEEKRGLVQEIVELCSFESLSSLEVNKSRKHSNAVPIKVEKNAYFRKGKVGDWRNYLTVEMAVRLDQIT